MAGEYFQGHANYKLPLGVEWTGGLPQRKPERRSVVHCVFAPLTMLSICSLSFFSYPSCTACS